jgi:hypothetical protein
MKTPKLPVSLWLPVIGAGAVLLIGAFARFDAGSSAHPVADIGPAAMQYADATPPGAGLPGRDLPADLSPGMAEIVKLAQARVADDVVLAYIKNSGQTYSPTADEILYLKDLGLSQNVISALFNKKAPDAPAVAVQTAAPAVPAPGPMPPPPALAVAAEPPPAAPPPPAQQAVPAPVAGAFDNALAPYGTWLQQPDYGVCWQPAVETDNPDWRPYLDDGQWLYSDSGWYWNSQYPWGWAAFHYGTWIDDPDNGWVWVPGNVWAPAWVVWRAAPSYIGWAPVPPKTAVNALAKSTIKKKPVGLPASSFTFVGASNLLSRNLPRHVLSAQRAGALVQAAEIVDGGLSRFTVSLAAHRSVPTIALRAAASPETAGPSADRRSLAVYRPISEPAAAPAAETPTAAAANSVSPAALLPSATTAEPPRVQLPPLRYPATPAPRLIGYRDQSGGAPFAAGSRVSIPERPRLSMEMPAMERPIGIAPRFEEPGHSAHGSATRVEEPAHAAPAPPPPSSTASSSHSGK